MSDVTQTFRVLSPAVVALLITIASFVAVANPLGVLAPVQTVSTGA